MRHLTIRLLAVAAVAAISLPAYAQSPIQLRFNVQPAATDAVWQNFKGMTLEKEAECYYSTDTISPRVWSPPRGSVFKGKTVLFNPGATTWSGGKQVFTPNTPPEPTNTLLMLPAGLSAQTKSIICRARILANGQNVTANANDIVFRLTDEIAKSGPPTAIVKLDQTKLAKKPVKPTTKLSVIEIFNPATNQKLTSAGGTLKMSYKQAKLCSDKLDGSWQASPGCLVELKWTSTRDSDSGEFVIRTYGKQDPIVAPSGYSPIHDTKYADGVDQLTHTGVFYVRYSIPHVGCTKIRFLVANFQYNMLSPEVPVTLCVSE